MAGLNQCNFIGNLGSDVSIRYTQDGKAVGSVNMAVTEKYKDQEKTEWVRLVFWGNQAEIVEKYAGKGSSLFVSGRMQTRTWERDGQKQYITEIIVSNFQFLGGAKGGQNSGGGHGQNQGYQQQPQSQNSGYRGNQNMLQGDNSCDVPF